MRQSKTSYSNFIQIMTMYFLYTFPMFTLLSSTAGWGILALLFIFVFSFVTVHLVFLARLGFLYQREKAELD